MRLKRRIYRSFDDRYSPPSQRIIDPPARRRRGSELHRQRYSTPVRHLFRLVRFPDEKQIRDDLTDASAPLVAERDTPVFHACRVVPEEILVLGEDDPARGDAVGDVLFVPSMEQARFDRARDVDAMEAKARRDGGA